MATITIHITGLNEATQGLRNLVGGLAAAQNCVLQNASNFLVGELQANAHVITGNMRNSCRVKSISPPTAVVEVAAPYAVYENARKGGVQGPHDFADRAEAATRAAIPDFINNCVGESISKYKRNYRYMYKSVGKGGYTRYHYGYKTPSSRLGFSRKPFGFRGGSGA